MIALIIVLLGNVDFVARLISMFFMVTYGALFESGGEGTECLREGNHIERHGDRL